MDHDVVIPAQLRAEYAQWRWTLVWKQVPQVETWRLDGADGQVLYLKAAQADCYPRVSAEAERSLWTRRFLAAPRVVDHGTSTTVDWQITEALPGVNAIAPELMAQPERLVDVLATGLRLFHAMPVKGCPFDFRLEHALARARERAAEGRIDPAHDFHSEHSRLDVAGALAELDRLKPSSEDLVVCHGDYCLPNVLVADWRPVGFLDLGEMGVADRWWDLAVATWSVTWNLGPGFEDLFLERYGVQRDAQRQAFYRLLYDVSS